MLRIKLILSFLLLQFCIQAGEKIILVIDPGHGGNDPGNLAASSKIKDEKELNLIIAKKVGDYIEKYLTNITVIYTRTDDTYPSLTERVDRANDKKADYFLSIHCNHSDNVSIHGTESHVHNWLSRKSVEWGEIMEKEFSTRAGRKSRGVKTSDDREKSLQVLKYTNMTSLLVECGFMSNVSEAAYLNTEYGQEIIASAIFRAFRATVQKQHPKVEIIPNKKEDKKEDENKDEKNVDVSFSVQIHSSKEKIDTEDKIFEKLDEKVMRKELLNSKNAYKYYYLVGKFKDRNEAEKMRKTASENGFKDAFIVTIKKD